MVIVTSTVKALIKCDDQQDHSQMMKSVYKPKPVTDISIISWNYNNTSVQWS